MATEPPSERDQTIPNAAVQQSIIQQAESAVASAQNSSEGPRRQEAFLQDADLVTPDAADDDLPPPAYGDTYGELRNEKDGLGTSAQVTDDGRVNIRINQVNRRLSRILTPALHQQVQGAQDAHPPPLPYIPPFLGGDDAVPPPPPLNVAIQVVGSRGDVQPFVALGKVLKDTYGHRVRLATHPNFRSFVQDNGLEFFSIGGDPSRLMAFMVKNPSLMPSFRSLRSGAVHERRKDVAEYIQGCWRSCYQADDGMDSRATDDDHSTARPFVADCIIANPPSFAHIHCAEKLGIPLHIMFTMPYSPTQAFPHPLANVQSSNADPQLTNYISYAMIEVLSWQGLGDIINRFRSKCLGLEPVSLTWAPGMLQRLKVPHTYCWSPALIPKPKDWGPHISIPGFFFLKSPSNYTPAPDLQAFLDAGPPPVYIGFGSIVLDNPTAMTELIFDAVRKTGQRVLLSKGWGGVSVDELQIPDNIFMLGNVPHDWLFERVSCVVHHGGAGTTSAGISAGRPTLVVPFFGDQPFWGAMVARAGAGPDPIPHKQLTADKLANAIDFCLKPESLDRAIELASKIAAERGSDMGAQSFHQYLEADRLRCNLAPSRPAAWRIRRTQIRLSPFAACTLANAKLLDFRDLKLFRPQEYETDEGPWDPISGGFTAFLGAVSGMAMGLADVPGETYKALQLPFKQSRQRNDESGSSKDPDMMRQTGPHTSKGIGRFAKALVQSPIELSMGLSKGCHNLPKLWGDDTVRSQSQVSDFKSGVTAAGKDFGLAWYDGVSGLVTQPWKGAQKEGVSGFFKGTGKGIGGFIAKPSATIFGVPGNIMKGVQKEVQKLFGSNVQNYIITSRTAQGYTEWLQSSDAEKQDVIVRWKLIQKYLKKKSNSDEMLQDIQRTASLAQSASTDASKLDPEGAMLAKDSSSPSEDSSLGTPQINETTRLSVHETSWGGLEEDSNVNRAILESVSQLHRQRQEVVDLQTSQENSRQAMAASAAEAERRAREASEDEEQLKLAMAQSLREQRQRSGDSEWESAMDLEGEDKAEDELEKTTRKAEKTAEKAVVKPDGSPGIQQPLHDMGHVAGTTLSEFEAHQQGQQGEKTTQEKTEEEIVLEYVKKQSLLEQHHQNRGKNRATATESTDDEDLQRALKLSMQIHGHDTEHQSGEASGASV